MSSSKDGKVSSFHLFPRCLFQWDGGFSQRIKFHDFIASQALGAVAPLCMGVGSKDAVPAGFPKKDSGLAPEGLSIRTGIGGRLPAIVVSHNGPKNQNTRGVPGGLPLALLFPLSLCKERGWPAGQTRFCGACWSLSAHIKRCPNEKGYPMRGHVLSPRGERTQRDAGGFAPRPPENLPIFSS